MIVKKNMILSIGLVVGALSCSDSSDENFNAKKRGVESQDVGKIDETSHEILGETHPESQPSSADAEKTPEEILAEVEPSSRNEVVLRSFAQYSGALSALTGVSVGEEPVRLEYDLVKNQLPPSSDSSRYSAFMQIAMTRLAFSYCNIWVDQQDGINDLEPEMITSKIMTSFFDSDPETLPAVGEIRDNLNSIHKAENLVMNDDQPRKTKLVCTALLSSSYFTLL